MYCTGTRSHSLCWDQVYVLGPSLACAGTKSGLCWDQVYVLGPSLACAGTKSMCWDQVWLDAFILDIHMYYTLVMLHYFMHHYFYLALLLIMYRGMIFANNLSYQGSVC